NIRPAKLACLLRIAERSSGEEKSRHYQGDERSSRGRFAGIACLATAHDWETVTVAKQHAVVDDIPQIRYGILKQYLGYKHGNRCNFKRKIPSCHFQSDAQKVRFKTRRPTGRRRRRRQDHS